MSKLLPLAVLIASSLCAAERPNIILVMTDDQGMGDMGWTGHPYIKTPALDKLRTQSLWFSEFQVSPSCAPTRCSIMSGRQEFYSGVTHTIYERERMSLKVVTLPQMLQKAGYSTGIFGKWHLGDEEAYRPDKRGFEETFIHGGGGIGQSYPGSCGDAPGNTYFDPTILHNGTFEKTTGFCTDVFFKQAITWMGNACKKGKPFFCYLPTNAPHGPYHAPKEWSAPYLKMGLTEGEAGFCGMVANIDWNMAKLLRQIEDWGIAENTLILFLGDNGTCQAKMYKGGMKGSKCSPDEGGTRVGLLARWKGFIPENETCAALTAHIDFYPTLCELAGIGLPEGRLFDGRSLLPLMKKPKAEWADRTLFTHVGRWAPGRAVKAIQKVGGMGNITDWQPNPKESPQKYKHASVRTSQYRFLPENQELYDIMNDREQKNDISKQKPEVVSKLMKAYDAWWLAVLPGIMENENLKEVAQENPFKILYLKQTSSR
jgi:arylsulfatase